MFLSSPLFSHTHIHMIHISSATKNHHWFFTQRYISPKMAQKIVEQQDLTIGRELGYYLSFTSSWETTERGKDRKANNSFHIRVLSRIPLLWYHCCWSKEKLTSYCFSSRKEDWTTHGKTYTKKDTQENELGGTQTLVFSLTYTPSDKYCELLFWPFSLSIRNEKLQMWFKVSK